MLDNLISEAKAWLADCGFGSLRGMNDMRIMRTVHWNYSGGFTQFVTADPDLTVAAARTALAERYSRAFAAELLP